ncbi:hypothetical protein RirG_265020 [Rhizophagus irregularis DAOM 197198w]|uniref:SWIM-type domain-containing protein n=1 Tax=Rhizophagus irregularis (strain DAOM 197198w) TaxID=1432141 RepID=A0A015IB81_RHIIW|nr:hypothetical protein RirG_265020 [Rhizophagus irregularis DAOM 197198w]
MVDDFYQQEMAREDDYDQPQSLFSSLIKNIPHNSIRQVWKATRHREQKSEPQHIILLDDGSHLCTCLWLINKGIVCRHFFQYNIEQQHKESVYQNEENKLEIGPRLSFQHLANFRQAPSIVQPRGPKQKYGFGMEYAKKALDLAIWTDKVDEFVNQIEYFIESVKSELSDQQENGISMHISDPLRVRHKGRQPNRYKSCGKPQKKKVRRIQDITNTTNKNRKEDVAASQEEKRKKDVVKIVIKLDIMLQDVRISKSVKKFFLQRLNVLIYCND